MALKEGVGTLFGTTVASQPAGLRAPSSDKAETQKRRLQLVRSISCIAPDRFPEGETKEAFKVKWAGANQPGKLGRTVTQSQMPEGVGARGGPTHGGTRLQPWACRGPGSEWELAKNMRECYKSHIRAGPMVCDKRWIEGPALG